MVDADKGQKHIVAFTRSAKGQFKGHFPKVRVLTLGGPEPRETIVPGEC